MYVILFQSIQAAVMSLLQVYPQRSMEAGEWRSSSLFNIVAVPVQMLNPAQTEKVFTHLRLQVFLFSIISSNR